MTSHYVVFQYLPDPLTDERINFGVATFGEGGFHASFVRDWRRVRSFGGTDVKFLHDFARKVAADPTLFDAPDEDIRLLLDEAPTSWINSIQVTPPRASTKPSNELVHVVARQFLRTSVRQRRAKDRRWVRRAAYETLTNALHLAELDGAEVEALVETGAEVQGAVEAHEFDLTVGNGHLVTAALALSFQRQSRHDLQRDYASAAWAIEDVRKSSPDLPLAVVMLPPVRGTSKTYEQARYVFERLEARPVPEDDLVDWAAEVAANVAAGVGAGG